MCKLKIVIRACPPASAGLFALHGSLLQSSEGVLWTSRKKIKQKTRLYSIINLQIINY
jgi:hypothetical protein